MNLFNNHLHKSKTHLNKLLKAHILSITIPHCLFKHIQKFGMKKMSYPLSKKSNSTIIKAKKAPYLI